MNRVLEYFIRAKDQTAGAINSARQRLADFTKSVYHNLMNIKAGFDMARGVVGKFVGFFTNAIGEAFKFESAVANFKTLLGSVDAAKQHLDDLRKFAAATPLTLNDLSDASKLLLSFGADVKDIMPWLKMLGDISMGNAQKFQGLALVFAQVKAAGRLMGQDLLQMINQGFNPLTIISQKSGKSVGELKKMMEDGAISFQMVEEAMKSATSAGGLFAGAMEESAKTGEGMLSTLKDNWVDALRTFGEKLMEVSKGGIQFLIDTIKRLKEDGSIDKWAEKAKSAIMAVIGVMRGLGDSKNRIQIFAGLKDVLVGSLKEGAKSAVEILAMAAKGIGKLIGDGFKAMLPFNRSNEQAQAMKDTLAAYKADGRYVSALGVGMFRKGATQEQFDKDVAERERQLEAEKAKKDAQAVVSVYGHEQESQLQRGLRILKEYGERTTKELRGVIKDEEDAGKAAKAAVASTPGIDSLTDGQISDKLAKEIGDEQEQIAIEHYKAVEAFKKEKDSEALRYQVQLLEEYYDLLGQCRTDDELKELRKDYQVQKKKIDFVRQMEEEQTRARETAERKEKQKLDRIHRLELKHANETLREQEKVQDAAEKRSEAAQEAVATAWGWYKDKDSLRQQIGEEEKNLDAQKQYKKDYYSLTHGRWSDEFAYAKELQRLGRTDKLEEQMAKWRKGSFGLDVETEATMRVALAEDAQKDADRDLRDINEQTARAAEAVENISKILENAGEE